MLLFRLALLNIGRNPKRSLITILAVAVGVAAIIFLWAFNDGTSDQMRNNVIHLFTGHIQIHAPGFDNALSPEMTLPQGEALAKKVLSSPHVRAASERVKMEALLGAGDKSRGLLLIGIDPRREPQVTKLQNHVIKGRFLSEQEGRDLLIGDRLAEKLRLDIGDKAVVMTQAVDGTLSGYAYRVSGIFHTGSVQVDLLSAYITLASGQELLGLEGASHEFVIALDDLSAIPSAMAALKRELNPALYHVQQWDEILPEPEMWVKWYETVMQTILITIMVVIAVGIMNTVLMSVLERTKELGVMMAIGTSPAQVLKLVVLETLVLELLGMASGIAMGCLIVLYFNRIGISFAELEQALSQSFVSTVTYPIIKWQNVIWSIVTLGLIASLISLYPAWRAGRMNPVKAIYHS